MNSLDISNSFMPMTKEYKLTTQIATTHTEISSATVDPKMVSDKVTISPEARSKVEKESSEEQSRNALHDLATTEDNGVNRQSQVDVIDSMIEKIKEEISKVMEQIAKLQTKDDEKSLEQQKALEAQLAALNSQLMELSSRKIEMLQLEA